MASRQLKLLTSKRTGRSVVCLLGFLKASLSQLAYCAAYLRLYPQKLVPRRWLWTSRTPNVRLWQNGAAQADIKVGIPRVVLEPVAEGTEHVPSSRD